MSTLVIILAETREYQLTFDNIKKNLIDTLNADLCLCIGVKDNYNYDNPFYKLAKYHFLYNEKSDDFADAFEEAFNEINYKEYEKLIGINTLYAKCNKEDGSIKYIGQFEENEINLDTFNEDEIVYHKKEFSDTQWKKKLFTIKNSCNNNFIKEENVVTYKKPLHWRNFLKIRNQFMGGIKDNKYQHEGSAGILIYFRWFLLKKLKENNLINKYERFVITRSDFIFRMEHPKLSILEKNVIWVPDGEKYDGYTDRHVVLCQNTIENYLNIFECMVKKSNTYYMKMKNHDKWNLEQLIKFHLEENKCNVKLFPYIMYSIRSKNGTTRWSKGDFNPKFNYYIKYMTEYNISLNNYNNFKNTPNYFEYAITFNRTS